MKHNQTQASITRPLRNILGIALIALISLAASSCRRSDLWDDMPRKISEFVSHYFPSFTVSNYTEGTNSYHIRLDNGPGLTFDNNCDWVAIDGYGMPLPQVLLFDQLPPKMYEYLQETEALNEVFSLERDASAYSATLLDSTLRYIIATGELTTR